jgi:hypothetical protein
MKKGASFAGRAANAGIPELQGATADIETQGAPENPAVFGGSPSDLAEGTEVELLGGRKYKVVDKPKE